MYRSLRWEGVEASQVWTLGHSTLKRLQAKYHSMCFPFGNYTDIILFAGLATSMSAYMTSWFDAKLVIFGTVSKGHILLQETVFYWQHTPLIEYKG